MLRLSCILLPTYNNLEEYIIDLLHEWLVYTEVENARTMSIKSLMHVMHMRSYYNIPNSSATDSRYQSDLETRLHSTATV